MSIISPRPSLRPILWLNLLLAVLSLAGSFLPIRLAISLRGVISSDGPTTIITSPNEAIVSVLPSEGQSYSKGSTLFQFQQPVFAAELAASQLEIRDLQERIRQSQIECKSRIRSSELRVAEARAIDNMNTESFQKRLISRLQLFQYRNAVNIAVRDLEDVMASCRQEQAQLRTENLTKYAHLRREQISQHFLSILPAPDNGFVYSINVKSGQRVRTGEALARFVRSNQSVATLRITGADRPFVRTGRLFDVTTPTYLYVPTQPIYPCMVETITPDLVSTSNDSSALPGPGTDQLSYLMRCRFTKPVDQGPYPLLIGMDVTAKASGNTVTLFQVLLRGYRATLRQTT